MCVINFNIVTVGTEPVSAEGRYSIINTGQPASWTSFNVNLNDMKTPDIIVNGNYNLQIRVQYPDLTYSDWTESSLFKVGNCGKLGNLYVLIAPGTFPEDYGAKDFNLVLYSNESGSGSTCYTPSVGAILSKDSDLTIPASPGKYLLYGAFNGCYEGLRQMGIGSSGQVLSVSGPSTGGI